MSCSGYNYACVPTEIKEAKEAAKKDKAVRLASKTTIIHEQTFEPNMALQSAKNGGLKSLPELEAEADEAVRQEMRRTYADANGDIVCYCCGRVSKVDDKIDPQDPQSLPVIQVGHFIKRGVKFLRWDLLNNIRPQCYLCNTLMHKEPEGKVFIEYRRKLILEIGEPKVLEMEQAHRRVFSPSRADLIELINNLK